jgi:hypothetical protein
MAQTHDIGSFYWHTINYGFKPKELWEKAESQEIDPPFRHGKGIAIRVPFTTRGVVLAKWKKTGFSEAEALTYAVNGRGLKLDEVNWDTIRYGAEDDKSKIQEA